MKSSECQLNAAVAYDIMGYLLRHPQAQDTARGIVEWWLLEQRIIDAHNAVDVALAELVSTNLLLVREAADGQTLYRLNPDKKDEAADLLRRVPRSELTN